MLTAESTLSLPADSLITVNLRICLGCPIISTNRTIADGASGKRAESAQGLIHDQTLSDAFHRTFKVVSSQVQPHSPQAVVSQPF